MFSKFSLLAHRNLYLFSNMLTVDMSQLLGFHASGDMELINVNSISFYFTFSLAVTHVACVS